MFLDAKFADAAMAGLTHAMLSWHKTNHFEGIKGEPTEPCEGGMKRVSTVSRKLKLYPRIDPVAIACVISADGQRCLLGNMRKHPNFFYSCLSGFIEPCESVQETVRREVEEESGVTVKDVYLVESQPWPLGKGGGCEIMIGCVATVTPGCETVKIGDADVNDVAWFSKEEARAMLDNHVYGAENDPKNMALPGPYAIAYHLVADFVEGKYDSLSAAAQDTDTDTGSGDGDWGFYHGCGVGVLMSVIVGALGAAGYMAYAKAKR
jgi:NAD+ diphosphatase